MTPGIWDTLPIEGLLGREPWGRDLSELAPSLRAKRILITGAGGSLGAALARVLLTLGPASVVLLEYHENTFVELRQTLGDLPGAEVFRFVLGDARDERRVSTLLADSTPDIVFHLAAYKHVPVAEEFPGEFVLANVLGTWRLALAAQKSGVGRLVYPSTDKAVNPTSFYGATKRVIEMMLQALAAGAQRASDTAFNTVRLVNVLGANGGVIQTFTRQIRAGEPVTITHPQMARYWMGMEESLFLLLYAACAEGTGHIFSPNCGQAVPVVEVARRLWRLLGKGSGELPVRFVGVRPGEKMAEELASDDEELVPTAHPGVRQVRGLTPAAWPLRDLLQEIACLEGLVSENRGTQLKEHLLGLARDGFAAPWVGRDRL